MPITPAQAVAQTQLIEDANYRTIVDSIDLTLSQGRRYYYLGVHIRLAPRIIEAYTKVGWRVIISDGDRTGLRFS